MNTTNEMIGVLDGFGGTGISTLILSLFEIALILFLLGNFVFIILLNNKIKILSDIIDCPHNKQIEKILREYISLSIIASVIAFFFILL